MTMSLVRVAWMRLRRAPCARADGITLSATDTSRRQTPRRESAPFRAVTVVAVLSLCATLPALAQEATGAEEPGTQEAITVSLALQGPPGCGSESDLSSRIAWRTSRV